MLAVWKEPAGERVTRQGELEAHPHEAGIVSVPEGGDHPLHPVHGVPECVGELMDEDQHGL